MIGFNFIIRSCFLSGLASWEEWGSYAAWRISLLVYPPLSGRLACSMSPCVIFQMKKALLLEQVFLVNHRAIILLSSFVANILSRILVITDCSAFETFGHRHGCRAVRVFLALVAAATISRSLVWISRSKKGEKNWLPLYVAPLLGSKVGSPHHVVSRLSVCDHRVWHNARRPEPSCSSVWRKLEALLSSTET